MTNNQHKAQRPHIPSDRYTSPAIIYQGQISTRAGSPIGPRPANGESELDPIDLFDNHENE